MPPHAYIPIAPSIALDRGGDDAALSSALGATAAAQERIDRQSLRMRAALFATLFALGLVAGAALATANPTAGLAGAAPAAALEVVKSPPRRRLGGAGGRGGGQGEQGVRHCAYPRRRGS